jgi:hypothetical protein
MEEEEETGGAQHEGSANDTEEKSRDRLIPQGDGDQIHKGIPLFFNIYISIYQS